MSNNKRRIKLAKLLETYGTRIQESAFEACLTKKQYVFLLEKAKNLLCFPEDSLRFYVLTKNVMVFQFGQKIAIPEEVIVV